MEWLLIIMTYVYGGMTANTILLPNQDACERAGKAAVEMRSNNRYSCIPMKKD